MATSGKAYFLSRPRRFGKSLTISTLEALFHGEKELFKGLYVYDKWDWSRKFPVIRIDWTTISHTTPEEIERDMSAVLRIKAADFGITLTREYAAGCLDELIMQLHRKTGEKVVVLVDEYDVPILDVMGKSSEELKDIQNSLHAIYKVLKGADDHLKFIFLTGVSKFSGLSVFSALNNLNDISLDNKFASLCGYTQDELESNFPEHIAAVAKKMSIPRKELLEVIRRWYNGYSWDGQTTVYNPFSALLFFDKAQFRGYWFATGTPTFLIDLIKNRNNIESYLQPIQAEEMIFGSYDPERLETVPLLFQTGYLTVKRITVNNYQPTYTLEAPNMEVRNAFIDHLFKSYTQLSMLEMTSLQENMIRQIKTCDSAGLEQSLKTMISRVPYQLHIEEEKYYHSLFLVWLYSLGFKAQGEISTNTGRIDAVWELSDMTVITEIKYGRENLSDNLLDAAMNQIREKKYHEAYLEKNRNVILMAIAFSGKTIGCRIAKL
jgi:hypothetical protein